MISLPYDDPGYAEAYDGVYLLSGANAGHTAFEIGTVERIARRWTPCRWLDVGCGTGYHLQIAQGDILRTGVDRAAAMLRQARGRPGPHTVFHLRDGRDLSGLGSFELVTSFWYGYVHQDSLRDVMQLLVAMAGAVSAGGAMMLGICNPNGRFDRLPRRSQVVYGAPARIDALVWSYTEPGGGAFPEMIAPHPDLILETLGPMFHRHAWLDYPVTEGAPGWKRRALLLEGRNA